MCTAFCYAHHTIPKLYTSFSNRLQPRVAAVFVFVSFISLLSIAGVPAQLKEIKVIMVFAMSHCKIYLSDFE